jgi:condensin complex subunit 3
MPGVVVNNPQKTIQTIFQESQKSAATHRKLVNSLRTVQLTCIQQNNEKAFNSEFIRCLNRVLPIKKSEPTADRVVKFIAHFIQHVQDKSIFPSLAGGEVNE